MKLITIFSALFLFVGCPLRPVVPTTMPSTILQFQSNGELRIETPPNQNLHPESSTGNSGDKSWFSHKWWTKPKYDQTGEKKLIPWDDKNEQLAIVEGKALRQPTDSKVEVTFDIDTTVPIIFSIQGLFLKEVTQDDKQTDQYSDRFQPGKHKVRIVGAYAK